MKLLFSEQNSDYEHYQFPYAIWAVPEPGETPSDIFNAGFLPSSRNLDRFYLCRQVRVNLAKFKPSSENRRILRKGAGIDVKLVPRDKYNYTPERREFFKTYADIKFGKDVMTFERLDALFGSPIISHLLVFTDAKTGAEIGVATLYIEGRELAYYYYAFYDLNYYARNLGMFMMTSAVALFAERGFRHFYLGTCYSQTALYKTQFAGAEFFNGFRWSATWMNSNSSSSATKRNCASTCWKPRNTAKSFTAATWKKSPRDSPEDPALIWPGTTEHQS
jgi:arginyl-tRNA--protein-N-Asp/Glu arginylyltransferase